MKSLAQTQGNIDDIKGVALEERTRLILAALGKNQNDPRQISKNPLLVDDELILKITGRRAAPLIDRKKEWKEHERWYRDRFCGVGVI